MARELVTHTWCDVCLDEDRKSPAREIEPVTIGSWKPRILALCDEHWDRYESFRTLLGDLGQIHDTDVRPTQQVRRRKAGTPSPIQPPFICRVPECERGDRPFANRESLQVHVRNQHGLLTGDYAAQYLTEEQQQPQGDEPLDFEEPGERPVHLGPGGTFECPECGRLCETPQGLGAHRSAAHGYVGVKKRTAAKAQSEVA